MANVPYIRNHDFRHSYCTYLLDNGLDPKTVAGQMGHSNVATTQNIYNHVTKKRENKLEEVLNSLDL